MSNPTFQQIAASFAALLTNHQADRKTMEQKIASKQAQLERLIRRRDRMPNYPYWTELLLRPVINLIKPHFADWNCDDERLSPMGTGCRVSVFFTSKIDEEKYIYLVFQPGDLDTGELFYETGETNDRYPKNTLGEINGFNRLTKPVQSIEKLVQFLTSQIIENGKQ